MRIRPYPISTLMALSNCSVFTCQNHALSTGCCIVPHVLPAQHSDSKNAEQKGRLFGSKDLLQVIKQRTIAGTRLVNLWQRKTEGPQAMAWLCWEGQPHEHLGMFCTCRQCHLDSAPSSSFSLEAGAAGGGGSMEVRGAITSSTTSCYFDSSITVI